MKFKTFVKIRGDTCETTIDGCPSGIVIWGDKRLLLEIDIGENGQVLLINHNGCFQFGIQDQVRLNPTRPWTEK